MEIAITYEYPSAYGIPVRHTYIAHSFAEAEEICKKVEALDGYKLIDVTRED